MLYVLSGLESSCMRRFSCSCRCVATCCWLLAGCFCVCLCHVC